MAWWQRELSLQLAASSAKPAPMNDDGPAVDLTSESEENPSGAASASTAPEALVEVALNDTKVRTSTERANHVAVSYQYLYEPLPQTAKQRYVYITLPRTNTLVGSYCGRPADDSHACFTSRWGWGMGRVGGRRGRVGIRRKGN